VAKFQLEKNAAKQEEQVHYFEGDDILSDLAYCDSVLSLCGISSVFRIGVKAPRSVVKKI
jgi:hypothetical protein